MDEITTAVQDLALTCFGTGTNEETLLDEWQTAEFSANFAANGICNELNICASTPEGIRVKDFIRAIAQRKKM